jgi:hypothetical protein
MQTFTGIQYIKIAIANAFGLDRKSFDFRLQWVDINRAVFPTIAGQAKEKILFAKAIKALEDAEAGIPTGFIMGLDATASGIQILASLLGCETTASNVNLVDTGQREDVYQMCTDRMNEEMDLGLTRDDLKHPIMTSFYNSTAQPEAVFGKDTPELALFYKVLAENLPGAREGMEMIQAAWNPLGLYHEFTLPDGHVAHIKVMKAVDKKIEIDELDHATFTHRAYLNESEAHGLSLPANVVQAVDGYIVREMQRRARNQGFELLCIHDSFWASPNHMQKVRQNYANILADICEMNLLQSILSELYGEPMELIRDENDLPELIRQSNYALS